MVHIPDGAYVRPIYDMVRHSSSSFEMAIDQSGESAGESTPVSVPEIPGTGFKTI